MEIEKEHFTSDVSEIPVDAKYIAVSGMPLESSSGGFEITFSNLRFNVPGKEILKGISGYCKPGRILAILGQSGAGKSTVRSVPSTLKKN